MFVHVEFETSLENPIGDVLIWKWVWIWYNVTSPQYKDDK